METILNKKNIDYLKQPLFLGEDLALQRYDRFKYPQFFELYKKQIEFFLASRRNRAKERP